MICKTKLYTVKGIKYIAEFARMCDMGGYESKSREWFLTEIAPDKTKYYIGNFSTVKKLENHIGY